MNGKPITGKRFLLTWLPSIVLLALLVFVLARYHHEEDVLGNITRKTQIVSRMKTDLLQSVKAEKDAVMADTDEESEKYARQSIADSEAVEEGRARLSRLIEAGKISEEEKLLREFDECWSEFRAIDRKLLGYAVQNTNLKAAALSLTQARGAMDRFAKSLNDLIAMETSTPRGPQAARTAYAALSAGLELYSLEAPHIIEPRDGRMDEIEADMSKDAERVRTAFDALDGLVEEKEGRTRLSEAKAAFADFLKINEEVVRLSRLNTNIKSFQLSLGNKRKVAAQCLEVLNTLQDAIPSRRFKATK